jgi:hypothetical protein
MKRAVVVERVYAPDSAACAEAVRFLIKKKEATHGVAPSRTEGLHERPAKGSIPKK